MPTISARVYAHFVVNEAFAKKFFRGRDPLDRQIRQNIGEFKRIPWTPVVGVVENVRSVHFDEAALPQIFAMETPGINNGENFAIRTRVPVPEMISQVHQALRSLDSTLALEDVHTMNERIVESNARRRFQTSLLTSFAGLAVALALVGLYCLMTYAIKQLTAEIGVRITLGSSRSRVLQLVLSQGHANRSGSGPAAGVIRSE
jgi:hypothetical protein